MRVGGRWLSLVVAIVAAGTVALSVTAGAQDTHDRAKRSKKPKQVSIVESVPLEVTASAAPLPVSVAALPAVNIAGQPLDVRVVNPSPGADPASNTVLTLSELDGVTISAETTSAEIDCDGYRAVTVFASCDPYVPQAGAGLCVIQTEFGCSGLFGTNYGSIPVATPQFDGSRVIVSPHDVLGPRMRIRLLRQFTSQLFPTINNVKVVVYLRR